MRARSADAARDSRRYDGGASATVSRIRAAARCHSRTTASLTLSVGLAPRCRRVCEHEQRVGRRAGEEDRAPLAGHHFLAPPRRQVREGGADGVERFDRDAGEDVLRGGEIYVRVTVAGLCGDSA
jgi:hypothetical protein